MNMRKIRKKPSAKFWSILHFAIFFSVSNTLAAPPPMSIPVSSEEYGVTSEGALGFLSGINRSSVLLGDLWGLRTNLSAHGISLGLMETSEYLGNLTGGVQRGFDFDGLTQIDIQMDTNRAFHHYGGLANVSFLNLHGSNLSANNLATLQTASGVEGTPSTRLWEAWYEQKFLEEDRLTLRVGQQSLDQEFMLSTNALYFVNTMFGWPMLPSADLPAGGPAFPLAAMGARVLIKPVDGVTLLAGAFNGDPSNGGTTSDTHGTNLSLGGGRMYIAEAQFSYPALGSMVEPGQSQTYGFTYKVGAWFNTNSFQDQAFDTQHQNNYAVYVVADQLVWRDEQDPNRTIAFFARVMNTPLKDRNLIDSSANLGVAMHSPFKNRAADILGFGLGYAHVSPQVALADLNNHVTQASSNPIRNSEKFVELTYQYQLKPWIQLQPDIQYVMNPGGGLINPSTGNSMIQNEWVVGLRANISF